MGTCFRSEVLKRISKNKLDWGLDEPRGGDCAVLDSRVKWKWNAVNCIISAFAICHGAPKKCPRPDAREGTYIKGL